ncbi:MAG: proton-translocating transhydrogenase family protein, partial [Candidatus Acidiferrum sp.]
IAIVAATSNIVGGFLITDRMLKMFKASGPRKP